MLSNVKQCKTMFKIVKKKGEKMSNNVEQCWMLTFALGMTLQNLPTQQLFLIFPQTHLYCKFILPVENTKFCPFKILTVTRLRAVSWQRGQPTDMNKIITIIQWGLGSLPQELG